MKRLFALPAVLLCLAPLPGWADEEIAVSSQEQQAVSLTIYNNNLALIKDKRLIAVPEGLHTLALKEVSARMKPETALLAGSDIEVIEQNFEYDLLTPQSLLQKYINREVTQITRHPSTGEETAKQVKVLSAGEGVVFQSGNQIETELTGRLVFPDVPPALRDRPTLTMLVNSTKPGPRAVELSYLSEGLSWRADYVAELNPADDRLNLKGWVTLVNESGAAYPKAHLQLVAGDVHLVQDALKGRAMLESKAVGAALGAAPMRQEAMFEYHLYSLDRPADIGIKQKKQVTLLQAENVVCAKEYLLRGEEAYFSAAAGEIGRKLKVAVRLAVKNDKHANLGMPLPAGTVRVYKKDTSGFLQFVGEDRVAHTPELAPVQLHLGDAFDITADKRQTDFKKLAGFAPFNALYESAYELTLNNAKEEAVLVKVQEPIPGDWTILSESASHTKENAHLASWQVAIPPQSSVNLTYRVQVRF